MFKNYNGTEATNIATERDMFTFKNIGIDIPAGVAKSVRTNHNNTAKSTMNRKNVRDETWDITLVRRSEKSVSIIISMWGVVDETERSDHGDVRVAM